MRTTHARAPSHTHTSKNRRRFRVHAVRLAPVDKASPLNINTLVLKAEETLNAERAAWVGGGGGKDAEGGEEGEEESKDEEKDKKKEK